MIESQRGGGGSIKILKLQVPQEDLFANLFHEIGDSITKLKADQIITLLLDRDLVSEREAKLMKSAIGDRAIAGPVNIKNETRAGILKGMLLTVLEFEK